MTEIPKLDFKGKVAFVTGAGSGIGRATAIAFTRVCASVTIANISQNGLQNTVAEIEAFGDKVLSVICDVSKSADIQAALALTMAKFGRLDAAFNNAGIEQPS